MNRNPLINLSLRQVDCHGALAALSEQSGFKIEFMPWNERMNKVELWRLGFERASRPGDFHWENVHLADCLREINLEYDLVVLQAGERMRLMPHSAGNAQSPRDHQTNLRFERENVLVYPIYASAGATRFLHYYTGATREQRDTMSLHLGVVLRGEDGDQIDDVADVVARYDTGETLANEHDRFGLIRSGPLPDELSTSVSLVEVPEGAAKVNLSGNVLCYADFDHARMEFELPVVPYKSRQQCLDLEVELVSFEKVERGASYSPVRDGGQLVPFYRVRAALYKPKGVRVSNPGGGATISASLRDAAGRSFETHGISRGGFGSPERTQCEIETDFKAGEELPARVVFDLVRRANPQPRVSFTLENIALP